MPRSLATYTAVAALTLGLAGGAAAMPAFADTAPGPGTPECTAQVDKASQVLDARSALAQAQATVRNDQAAFDKAVAANNTEQDVVANLTAALGTTLTDPIGGVTGLVSQAEVDQAAGAAKSDQSTVTEDLATLNADKAKVATARTDLASAISQQTTALCTGPTTAAPATESVADIDAATDALSCSSSNTDLQAIDKAIAARQAAGQSVGDAETHLSAKVGSLNCSSGAVTSKAAAQTAKDCGCITTTTVTEAPTTAVVTPKTVVATQDDGSTATTSGHEVTDVPAGSVQTGAV